MAIVLHNASKSFLLTRRNRRPLYRQLMLLGAGRHLRGAEEVLKDVNLEIPEGSRVAVVGRNGAGKSTLLRLIAGIYWPNAGSVRVDGRICCFLEPGAGAAPALPVRDNVFLYAALAGLGYRETRASVQRILEFASLTDQEYTWVEHLSFGMQQRLFMSIQLEVMRLQRAEVFLFDEFLMGVDKSFRTRVEDALTRFPGPRQIVLHASHDHNLLQRTCSRALHIADRGIRRDGSVDDVLQAYRGE